MTQPNTDAGRARMQRENVHQLGLVMSMVCFLPKPFSSLSLSISSPHKFIGVFLFMIHQ